MQNIFRLVQKFQNVLLFLLLQFLCFVLLLSQRDSFHKSSIASSSNVVVGTIYSWSSRITSYFHLKKESEQLAAENAFLKKELYGHQIQVGINFTRVDDSIFHQQYDFIPAKVINSSKSSRHNFLTLNVGAEHKVGHEMAVIGTKGIVGITVAYNEFYSTVIPIINEDFTLAIRHQKSKSFGRLIWNEDDDYRTATVLDVPSNIEVAVGDLIETRGSDAIFPEGIPVGTVRSVEPVQGETYQLIKIDLVEDFAALYNVDVIKNTKKNDQKELETQTIEKFNQ